MSWSKEMVEEVESFFDSTAGRRILAELEDMQRSHNDLRQVMNEAQSASQPEIVVARHGGIVEGVELMLHYVESIRKGDLS